ncbi:MAG: hypothetical protein ABII96_03615 [Candidatus Zixiibacteriota bacterium]
MKMVDFVTYLSVKFMIMPLIPGRDICQVTAKKIERLGGDLLFQGCAEIIILSIKESLHYHEFIRRHRKSEKDFTSQRKLPFHLLMCFIDDFAKDFYQRKQEKFFEALRGRSNPHRHMTRDAVTKVGVKNNFALGLTVLTHWTMALF